jgi:hypothetical protein
VAGRVEIGAESGAESDLLLFGSHETSPTKQPTTELLDDDNIGSDRSYDDDNAIINVIIE